MPIGPHGHVNGPTAEPAVWASQRGPTTVITIRGRFDAAAGTALREAAHEALEGSRRIEIDLRPVDSFDLEGAASLVDCRALADGLPEGLHYRTGRGPGRDALLAAYANPA